MDEMDDTKSMKGLTPESWLCVDCGMNTAPGMLNRIEMEKAIEALGDKWGKDGVGVPNKLTATTEVYCVTAKVWKAAKIKGDGGCLCIRCLEKRLGRQLKPKDFVPDHIFNDPMLPGTALRRDRLSWYYKDKPIEQVLQRVEVMEAKRHG